MSIVTTDEVIARVPAAGALETAALQGIIDANEVLMAKRLGGALDSTAAATVTIPGYPSTVLLLPERVASIDSVTEHWRHTDSGSDVVLDATDWRLFRQGTAIERLIDGANRRDTFADEVIIEYTPWNEEVLRKNVLIQLVEADLNYAPGIQSQRLGDYAETRASSAQGQASLVAIKDDILAQLDPTLPVFA